MGLQDRNVIEPLSAAAEDPLPDGAADAGVLDAGVLAPPAQLARVRAAAAKAAAATEGRVFTGILPTTLSEHWADRRVLSFRTTTL